MEIKISQVKEWREQINATHLIVYAIYKNKTQCVATHGETEKQSYEAAKIGNVIKDFVGFPKDLCNSKPLKRVCRNCSYYRSEEYDNSIGYCLVKPGRQIVTRINDKCGLYT